MGLDEELGFILFYYGFMVLLEDSGQLVRMKGSDLFVLLQEETFVEGYARFLGGF